MRINVKILGTKSSMRYTVARLIAMAETILRAEYPDLEVEVQMLKTEEVIFKYTQVLMAPGLVINEKLAYATWIPSKEQVLGWMREAIAETRPV
jgi:hypothetical protein